MAKLVERLADISMRGTTHGASSMMVASGTEVRGGAEKRFKSNFCCASIRSSCAELPVHLADHLDKGHGRIEERRIAVLREVDWLAGGRRFPGELRLPGAACLVRAETRVESRGATRTETRYFISSRALTATEAAAAVRGHWAIENRLHWVLDVTFADDQSRLRKGHGARNMATVRHFALNLVRTATDKRSIKSRRKLAGWSPRLPPGYPLLTPDLNCQPSLRAGRPVDGCE